MDKKKILDNVKDLPYFKELVFIYLFGSSCYGKFTKRSDRDICCYYQIEDKKKLFKLQLKISSIFPENYDVQMFQLLPLYIKKEVFKGELLYTSNKELVYDIAKKTRDEYEDFKPRYKYILYGKNGIEGTDL